MAKRFLFCTGEGLGNIAQTIPVIRTMIEVLNYRVDFWHIFGSYDLSKFIPYVDKWFNGSDIHKRINLERYTGKVSTIWGKDHLGDKSLGSIKLFNDIKRLDKSRSEVDTYMDIARDLGVKEEDILWHGNCLFNSSKEKFDVVLNNGYNKKVPHNRWVRKSYPYYDEVANILKKEGLRVCSIGTKNEYINGTEDRTGLELLDSLGIVKNTGVFVSNDTGLYHCANALEVPNVVIFTYTSMTKNYEPRFHKYSTVVKREDLNCLECQDTDRFKKCTEFKCREIDPEIVAEAIFNKLEESKELPVQAEPPEFDLVTEGYNPSEVELVKKDKIGFWKKIKNFFKHNKR